MTQKNTVYPKDLLERLYREMLRIRFCEESLVDPILKGDIKCPCHLCTGQEAVAVGVCAALEERDYIFGNHRSHGHYLAKGGDLKALVAEMFGKETGCSRGRGGSMHVIAPEKGMLGAAPIVGGTISLAVGAALASRIRGEDRVTVSFFGDGAAGEGVLYESLNFASLKKLPVIFACENNYYSTHMPIRDCRKDTNIYSSSVPFCVHGFRTDGNNVLQVYESTRSAVEMCRKGDGPIFIEFATYRMRGHVGPDDNIQGTHQDIRPQNEIDEWRMKDPVIRFEGFLQEKKILSKEKMTEIKQLIEREIQDAHEFALNSPYPAKGELSHYVFRK